ncbi:MAG: V-type ATP synthase subunit I [Candidatus Methanoplasma sp.]|nr:V-type ATP synthase subunit I [Candidatus Methanoplasma sp.]
MSRIVIVGTKSRLDEAIEAFYSVKALHLIDHTTGADGLSIGTPLSHSSKASERLLKVRAIEKELGIAKTTQTGSVPVDELQSQIDSESVENIESEVLRTLDKRNDLNQRITVLNSNKKNLTILAKIPVDLELYSGYRTIASIAGSVEEDPTKALEAIPDSEYFVSFKKKEGGAVALFVKASERDKAASALSDFGFTEIAVPEGTGSPADALVRTEASLKSLTAELESVEKEIESLQLKHKTFLRASDEELSIQVEKGEVPLRIAVGDYSYIADAWVPTDKVDSVKAELEAKLGNDVHIEFEETRGRNLHEEEHAEERFKKVPTKQTNGLIAKEFEYATSLVSIPKYQEIDPTILLTFFLPLFFGFMIGDCGYAIPFIIIGAYGLKVTHHKDWRAIATVLFFGGIWAFLFGFFFFGEAMGMHFIGEFSDTVWNIGSDGLPLVGSSTGTSVTWDGLLGGPGAVGNFFPDWFTGLLPEFLHHSEVIDPITGLPEEVTHHGVGKLVEVGMLLKLSVYVGIVHMMIAYICGLLNIKRQHGGKAALFEKGGWIITFSGMIILCFGITKLLFDKSDFDVVLPFVAIGVVMLLVGTVITFKVEKAQAILELPGLVGNILSYTRLAAIGMSKAGMALAFNYIVFGMIINVGAGGDISPIMLIIGLVLFGFLHLVVWTLGILSAGLHALRLQFVELMSRFFIGGGIKYDPLRTKREKTVLIKKETNKEV